MSLTPDEQKFFETGELQPSMQPQPDTVPTPDPLALSALNNTPAPTAAPAAEATPAPTSAPAQPALSETPDPAEFLRRSLAEAQQRVAALEHQIQNVKPAPAEPEAPDPSADPLGAMFHKLDSMQKQVAALQAGLQQTQQQAAQTANITSFQQQVQALKAQFAATTPDFDAASQHLRNVRIADLRSFGMTDAQIARQVAQEEFGLAEAAVQQGRNPAQVIYEMSKRHGYAGKAQPSTTPPANPASASIDQIQRAQAAARDLSAAPTTPSEVTLEGLRAASDADLNKMILDPKLWNQITGGNSYPL